MTIAFKLYWIAALAIIVALLTSGLRGNDKPSTDPQFKVFKAGWIVAKAGATESELESFWIAINNGDTNWISQWLAKSLAARERIK